MLFETFMYQLAYFNERFNSL